MAEDEEGYINRSHAYVLENLRCPDIRENHQIRREFLQPLPVPRRVEGVFSVMRPARTAHRNEIVNFQQPQRVEAMAQARRQPVPTFPRPRRWSRRRQRPLPTHYSSPARQASPPPPPQPRPSDSPPRGMYERNYIGQRNALRNFLEPLWNQPQYRPEHRRIDDFDGYLESHQRALHRLRNPPNVERFWQVDSEEENESTWCSDSESVAPRARKFSFAAEDEPIVAGSPLILPPMAARASTIININQRIFPRELPALPSVMANNVNDDVQEEEDVRKPLKTKNLPLQLTAERIEYLNSLTSNSIRNLPEEKIQAIVEDLSFGPPHLKYKTTYPFVAEGILQKDQQFPNQLRVFSARLGKVTIPDDPRRENKDYVYFLVVGEGQYAGFCFAPHDSNLISTKFPSENAIEVRGYAIMAHTMGVRPSTLSENSWICYNDSMGMMRVNPGAARISIKKMPIWDKQLDIVSVQAKFENNRFFIKALIALTNQEEKKMHFPKDPFLVPDAVLTHADGVDFHFYSQVLDLQIALNATLVGVELPKEKKYQIVAAPTFNLSTRLIFRGILLIENDTFWRGKEWIRGILTERMEEYKRDARIRRGLPPPLVKKR